jgi:hypothetical protein
MGRGLSVDCTSNLQTGQTHPADENLLFLLTNSLEKLCVGWCGSYNDVSNCGRDREARSDQGPVSDRAERLERRQRFP